MSSKITSQILIVNQKQLSHPDVLNYLNHNFSHEWKAYEWEGYQASTDLYGLFAQYSRTGINVLPFKDSVASALEMTAPEYDHKFNLDFAEVSYRRLKEIWNQNTKPWIVFWSGGIDSTAIVVAILKHIEHCDYHRIKIACTRHSIFENPRFFFNHIQPNFEIVDSSDFAVNITSMTQYQLIDGEPADLLYMNDHFFDLLVNNDRRLYKNAFKDPDDLIDRMAATSNKQLATWYYDTVISNIVSTNVPIETYHDFLWWIGFNFIWIAARVSRLVSQHDYNPTLAKSYMDNYTNWFSSPEYQQWSMNSNLSGIKYGTNFGEFKLAPKKYIFDFDRDLYYYNFKTKIHSFSHKFKIGADWFCVLDDFTRLNLKNDFDRILDLLPGHINHRLIPAAN
jgi:hypothetical protein